MKFKERPYCRRTIVNGGWRPCPSPETWNGETALTPDKEEIPLTDGFRKQLGKMIEEGYWGKAVPLRSIQSKLNESESQREHRLQNLCDSMVILDDARPIPINSGDRLLSVEYMWPEQSEWDWEVCNHVPIMRPAFACIPCWVFEENNPVSATARAMFAFLCNRGLLSVNKANHRQISISVPKKATCKALSVPQSAVGRALCELEDLELVTIDRIAVRFQGEKDYCNFYNPDSISVTEDKGRWARIRATQLERDSTVTISKPFRQKMSTR